MSRPLSMNDIIKRRIPDIAQAIRVSPQRAEILQSVKDFHFVLEDNEIKHAILDVLDSSGVTLKFIETALDVPDIVIHHDLFIILQQKYARLLPRFIRGKIIGDAMWEPNRRSSQSELVKACLIQEIRIEPVPTIESILELGLDLEENIQIEIADMMVSDWFLEILNIIQESKTLIESKHILDTILEELELRSPEYIEKMVKDFPEIFKQKRVKAKMEKILR